MKFLSTHIKAIIFDLGGVILNLNPQKTIEAFASITGLSSDTLLAYASNDVFRNYEKGKTTSSEFRNGLRELFQIYVSDAELDVAWNAMLLELPLARLEMIRGLQKKYKTYILSNTNEIHIRAFDKIVDEATSGKHINNYFNTVYYSHKVGMRKPDAEIFDMVLIENGLEPSSTLFIDDTWEHIESAKKLGLQTWYLTNQEELFTVFGNE